MQHREIGYLNLSFVLLN